MVSKPFKFKDKQKLYQMALLRRAGWSFTSLAIIFDCDRTSIRDRCRKYSIFPMNEVFTIERISEKILKDFSQESKTEWTIVNGERICLGRNYADYL